MLNLTGFAARQADRLQGASCCHDHGTVMAGMRY
jgi:hypothetical protein